MDEGFLAVDDGVLGYAFRAVAVIGLQERRQSTSRRRGCLTGPHQGLDRNGNAERDCHSTDQTLVIAGRQRQRAGAGVGQSQHLEHGGDVQLLEGIVVEALVAQVEDEIGAQPGKIQLQRRMVVQIAELVAGELRERGFQAPDIFQVLGIESAVSLDGVRQIRVAQDDSDIDLPGLALWLATGPLPSVMHVRHLLFTRLPAHFPANLRIPVGHRRLLRAGSSNTEPR